MPMTPRQRWLAVFAGHKIDRIPCDFWAPPDLVNLYRRQLECQDNETVWRKLHVDRPRTVSPHNPQADSSLGIWGVPQENLAPSPASHPLSSARTVDDLRKFPWPTPDDFDYGPIAEALAKDDGYRIVQAGCARPFHIYRGLRGPEQAARDLADNPAFADAILGRITDFCVEHNRRIFQAGGGKIDLTCVSDNIGSLISPESYRRSLRNCHKRLADLARSFNVHVIFRTDGLPRTLAPDLIDTVGIEILNPGGDCQALLGEFGNRLVFHGGVDVHGILASGTAEEVVAYVRQVVAAGKGRRWICAPSHPLDPRTPLHNVIALYWEIFETGRM